LQVDRLKFIFFTDKYPEILPAGGACVALTLRTVYLRTAGKFRAGDAFPCLCETLHTPAKLPYYISRSNQQLTGSEFLPAFARRAFLCSRAPGSPRQFNACPPDQVLSIFGSIAREAESLFWIGMLCW